MPHEARVQRTLPIWIVIVVLTVTGFAFILEPGSVAGALPPQVITTLAGTGAFGYSGDGGPATSAVLGQGFNVALDSHHNVVFVDSDNDRVRIVAATSGTFYGVAMTTGRIYTIAGNGVEASTGDTGPALAASFQDADGLAIDSADNILIGEQNRVRVVAAASGTFYGVAMTADDIYTIAGGSFGPIGDGGPATSANLVFPFPALDSSGNVLIADSQHERIRVVAESTGTFYGQAMTTGDVYTIAGSGTEGFAGDAGPATTAELDTPQGVVVDANGNVVVSDWGNNRIRLVAESSASFFGRAMTAGRIYTIAGTGTAGFSGDGQPGSLSRIRQPQQVALDASGNVVFADAGNEMIRVITGVSGSRYGQPMTVGHLYTIAGGGFTLLVNGVAATDAVFDNPTGVAVDHASGAVFIGADELVYEVGGGSPCTVGLALVTPRLAPATLGQPYTASVAACGGTAPYRWKKIGKLPKGLKLNAKTGVISGTPKKTRGTFGFSVQLRDKVKHTTSRHYKITVS